MIRGLRVLIEVKVLKYHEVTRFQNRSRSFKEQHIAAWIEQIDFVICQGAQTQKRCEKVTADESQTQQDTFNFGRLGMLKTQDNKGKKQDYTERRFATSAI